MLILIINIFVGVIQLFFALVVYKSNQHYKTNIYLALFLIFTGFWLITLGLLPTSIGYEIWFARLVFAIALAMCMFFCLFVISFTFKERSNFAHTIDILLVLAFSVVFLIVMSDFTIVKLSVPSINKLPVPGYGIGIAFYIIYLVFAITTVIAILVYNSFYSKDKYIKMQSKYVAIALTIFASFTAIGNLIIPYVTGSTYSSQFAVISVLILNSILTYSVIKHKLLNIRPVVVKSVAYVISIATIAIIYVSVLISLSSNLTSLNFTNQEIWLLGLLGIFVTITFQYIRSFFDKLVGRIFYQNPYDSESVINSINSVLVSATKIDHLLYGCSQVIRDNLSIKDVYIYIEQKQFKPFHFFGASELIFDEKEWIYLYDSISKNNRKTFILNDNNSDRLTNIMKRSNIGCIIKMNSGGKNVGLLMFGSKIDDDIYSNRDLRLFSNVSDSMAIAAQNILRYQEIERFNETLQQNVKKATADLQKSNEKLKSLDEAKDEFISMASHQLRTPLTSVKGYISMLLEGDAGPITDQQKTFLSQAFTSSQRMVYLIADLLNVSRLKTGKFVIEPTEVDLTQVVQTEVEQLQTTADSRGLTLKTDFPKDFPILMLDETKIHQVIMNFIDNAIYYTPSGGTITVALKHTDKTAELTVTDTGIGVPKKSQHELFTKFYRAENAQKARPDGTGLGLYMAKKVIIAQGGSIIFSSTENKGSTFGFSFALSKVLPNKTD